MLNSALSAVSLLLRTESGSPGFVIIDVVVPERWHSAVPYSGVLRLVSEAGGHLARLIEVDLQQVVVVRLLLLNIVVRNFEDHLHVVRGTESSNSSVNVSLS